MTAEATTTGTPYALRQAEVLDARRVSPAVVRVTLGGPDLGDLPHAAPDGYLKLFFPRGRGDVPELPEVPADGDIGRWYRSYLAMPDAVRPPMRTYTLRRRRDHPGGVEIDVDLVLHGDGPGSTWARDAAAGDRVAFTGPYGLYAPRDEHDAVLLVGDETAVPAMGAIVEALPAGTRAEIIASVSSAAETVSFPTTGAVETSWVHGGPSLLDVLRQAELPGERPYVWLAGEAGVVRDLRRHLIRERGVDKRDIQFCGYWRRGKSEDQAAAEALAAAERGEEPAE
ncbi:siderophore-interacting protein [Actinomycetospora termitidis]|uniref:Siderophore-interacting protein n=1 Tax=Actinomycetospora termitidis TaxID=3053470 RepID=A0ABT7MDK9_9PSEU|nr:siderophore-interacting protein [Actinomycetospora sp. Odt1-22]MDL5158067.1 siderophore-interacting protein [Actinomycetospora sp. Odt1-22]